MKKNIQIFLILAVLIISGHLCFAQQELEGVIIDNGGGARIASVQIRANRSGIRAVSNDLGIFKIVASVGDTLSFNKTGYRNQSYLVTTNAAIVIKMQREISLDEVRIVGQTTRQEMDEVRDQYKRKGSFYEGKPPLLAYIFTPLTAFYELVGKTPNQARRFNNYYSRELQEVEVDRRFTASKIQSVTNLSGDDLKNFMFTYRPSYDAISQMADYDLTLYIQQSAKHFNDAGKPKGLLSLPKVPKAPDLSEKIKY